MEGTCGAIGREIEGCDAITEYKEKTNRVFALSVREWLIDDIHFA